MYVNLCKYNMYAVELRPASARIDCKTATLLVHNAITSRPERLTVDRRSEKLPSLALVDIESLVVADEAVERSETLTEFPSASGSSTADITTAKGLLGIYQEHQMAAEPIPAYLAYKEATGTSLKDPALRRRMDIVTDAEGNPLLRKTGRKYGNIPRYSVTAAGEQFVKRHLGVEISQLPLIKDEKPKQLTPVVARPRRAVSRRAPATPSLSSGQERRTLMPFRKKIEAVLVTQTEVGLQTLVPEETASVPVVAESPLSTLTQAKRSDCLIDYDALGRRLDRLITDHREKANKLREGAQTLLDEATKTDEKRLELESMQDRLAESRRQIEALQLVITVSCRDC